MIVTAKKAIPFRWMAVAVLPWSAVTFQGGVMGTAFVFSLKKFVENPAGLTFILSLPAFISFAAGPIANFLSDRVWTRFGRRKPFVIFSWTGVITALALLPLMPTMWSLVAIYLCYAVFLEIGAPIEPLKQEIVPPPQRGRATGVMQWVQNIANLIFYFVAFGRFDDVRFMWGIQLSGERANYWAAALMMTVMLLLIILGIRETDPKSPMRGQYSVGAFFRGLLDRDLWPVYTLILGGAVLSSGLGPLGNLLYTDQWGYTKQQMGINVAVGGVLNLFFIGLLAVVADKLNRIRAYQLLLAFAIAQKIGYYCYVEFVLPDKRPSLIELVVFGELLSVTSILTSMVVVPLMYDYVSRNRMGTLAAGSTMINRLTGIVTLNGIGLFVWAYAAMFRPPAGEMTRVVLQDEQPARVVSAALREGAWTNPRSGLPTPGANVQASAWYATGLVAQTGRCWELRLRDRDSEKLSDEKEQLARERSPAAAEMAMARDRAEILRRKGQPEAAAETARRAAEKGTVVEKLGTRIAQIDRDLAERANNFKDQAVRVLGPRMLADGTQVLGASVRDALMVEIATAVPPSGERLERLLEDLRRERAAVIDLRRIKRGEQFGVAISALLPAGREEMAFAEDLRRTFEKLSAKRDPKLVRTGFTPLGQQREPAFAIDLLTVEEPLDTRVSPINRAVYAVGGWFGAGHDPGQRLAATARSLRLPGETDHVRAFAGERNAKTISVVTLFGASAAEAASTDDPIGGRLQQLLGPAGDPSLLRKARAFFDRVEKAAAAQRITVARPIVATGYAPMKYDYMCGYLWMFVMGLIGLTIVRAFVRREAKGLIRKRGVEEAQATLDPTPAPQS